MTDKLVPYGEERNIGIVAKIGHGKAKYRGRLVNGRNVERVERLTS